MSGKQPSDEDASTKKPAQNSDEGTSPSAENDAAGEVTEKKEPLDPTRYGDWEKNGRCIDF